MKARPVGIQLGISGPRSLLAVSTPAASQRVGVDIAGDEIMMRKQTYPPRTTTRSGCRSQLAIITAVAWPQTGRVTAGGVTPVEQMGPRSIKYQILILFTQTGDGLSSQPGIITLAA